MAIINARSPHFISVTDADLATATLDIEIYTGDKTNLFADKVEINLTTKDTKIFMNDSDKKVLVEGIK